MERYDVVVYGATGFTGNYIVQHIVKSSHFKDLTFAIAGRNEAKLKEVLENVSKKTGKDIRLTPIIIASTDNAESLAAMAKQAKVIVNSVGPYELHGEPVVKAAIENGASHLDISGEDTFLERIEAKYGELARKNNVYVVGACGWDSIPCDLGVNYLKKNFGGDAASVETYVQFKPGPKGYAVNTGTYQSLILIISQVVQNGISKIAESFWPKSLVKGGTPPPFRGVLFKVKESVLGGWALPFPGADPKIVNRSQYYAFHERKERPIQIKTYFRVPNFFVAGILSLWLSFFSILAAIPFTRRFLQNNPELCSFNLFKSSGPSEDQIAGTTFTYWIFGTGYDEKLPVDKEHLGKPNKKVTATCKGADPAYNATSGCILSSALAILKDADNLPKNGGVYTTAAAFGETKIYDFLCSFGITFQIEETIKL